VASFYNYYDTKAGLLIALAEEFHAEATQLAVLPYRAGLSGEEALRARRWPASGGPTPNGAAS
jgi:hypothetical protein